MSQFVTQAELEFVAKKMAEIGYPVIESYIPQYQVFPTPEQGDNKFWHLAFKNKKDKEVRGFNAGLILKFMRYSPLGWPEMIINEINRPPFWEVDFE